MHINRSLENSLKNVDPTPLYAVVGAGDKLVAKLCDARDEVQARGEALNGDHSWDPRTLSATLQAAAAARVETVTAEVRTRTADAKTLPDQATVLLSDVVAQAIMTYAELAQRGKDVVARVRGQQEGPGTGSSSAASPSATTASRATTTKSTTTKSAAGTSGTTRAAKKSSASTTKRAKSTTSKTAASAKKTAEKSTGESGGESTEKSAGESGVESGG